MCSHFIKNTSVHCILPHFLRHYQMYAKTGHWYPGVWDLSSKQRRPVNWLSCKVDFFFLEYHISDAQTSQEQRISRGGLDLVFLPRRVGPC